MCLFKVKINNYDYCRLIVNNRYNAMFNPTDIKLYNICD